MGVETILENHELFKKLSGVEREKLASVATCKSLGAGTVIFRQDEAANGLYLLDSGRVELSRINRKGTRFALARLRTGETFGELCVLDRGSREVTAETTTPSEVIFFDLAGISRLVDNRERAAIELVHILSVQASGRLRELNRAIVESLSEPTAIGGDSLARRARPDRDFFHGLMAGLFVDTPGRDDGPG